MLSSSDFKLYLFINLCIYLVYTDVHVRQQHEGVGSSSLASAPGYETQVVRIGRRCLYPLSHLANPACLTFLQNLVSEATLEWPQ